MKTRRFGLAFPRLFAAAILQETPFALMIHLPGYLTGLGAAESAIGVLYAASAGLSLALRPLMGRMIDLSRRRTVILIGGAVNIAVVLALTATSAWGWPLWLLFLVWRVAQITLFTAMLTYGADSIPIERRTQGLALFGLSGLIPIGVGGYIGDVVIEVLGFDGLFATAAAIAAASWLVVWALPALPVRGAQPRRSFWAPLTQRNLLPLWFVALLFAVGIESLFTFTRTYVDDRGFGNAGVFFAVYGAAAVVTRLAGGQRYDRIAHRPLLVSSIAAFGAGLGVMAVAGAEPWLYGAAAVMGTAHGACFPLLSSEVVNRARVSERGSAMAAFTSLFDMALLIGAPAVGFLIDGADYTTAFSVAGAGIVFGALVYGGWDRRPASASAPLVAEEALE